MPLPKQPKSHNKSLVLHIVHLPLLILLIALLALGGMSLSNLKPNKENPLDLSTVLGDDSDDNDDNDDDDDDDDDDNGNDDDDNDDDDDDEDDFEDEFDDDDEFENRFEFESEDGKTESKEIVTNEDGSYTIIRRKVEDDKSEVRVITVDAFGNKISEVRYKTEEDGDSKMEIKTHDAQGNDLTELKFETDEGRKVELRVRDGDTGRSKVEYDAQRGRLIVKVEDKVLDIERELKISVVGAAFGLTHLNSTVLTQFPLIVDDDTGLVFVTTPNGNIELGTMPSTIERLATATGELDDVDGMALESDDDDEGTLTEIKYVVKGSRTERFLGLFEINIPLTAFFDISTGTLLETQQNFITQLLDLLSV